MKIQHRSVLLTPVWYQKTSIIVLVNSILGHKFISSNNCLTFYVACRTKLVGPLFIILFVLYLTYLGVLLERGVEHAPHKSL